MRNEVVWAAPLPRTGQRRLPALAAQKWHGASHAGPTRISPPTKDRATALCRSPRPVAARRHRAPAGGLRQWPVTEQAGLRLIPMQPQSHPTHCLRLSTASASLCSRQIPSWWRCPQIGRPSCHMGGGTCDVWGGRACRLGRRREQPRRGMQPGLHGDSAPAQQAATCGKARCAGLTQPRRQFRSRGRGPGCVSAATAHFAKSRRRGSLRATVVRPSDKGCFRCGLAAVPASMFVAGSLPLVSALAWLLLRWPCTTLAAGSAASSVPSCRVGPLPT